MVKFFHSVEVGFAILRKKFEKGIDLLGYINYNDITGYKKRGDDI